MTTVPDWIVPGAEVVIVGGRHGNERVGSTLTIDRVLKRDVVLSDGQRYSLKRASDEKIRGLYRSDWTPTSDLYPADSPYVAKIREKEREAAFTRWVENRADDIGRAARLHQWDEVRQLAEHILEKLPK